MTKMLAKSTGLTQMSFDYSEASQCSEARLDAVVWGRHWARVWEQSLCFCDWGFPRINYNDPYGDYEIDIDDYGCRLYKAVTGRDMTREQALALGHKIFTLDKAIWTLQGRHRNDEVFAEHVYSRPNPEDALYPMYKDGKWDFCSGKNRLDKFEDFKTRFYLREGWAPSTGWPTRKTLEEKFSFSIAGNIFSLPIHRLLLLQSDGRNVEAVSDTQIYRFYGKLSTLERDPALRGFIRCHQSFLVNPAHIQKICNNQIWLSNGSSVSISKGNVEKVKSCYMCYALGELP